MHLHVFEQVDQGEGVLPPAEPHQDPVSLLNQAVPGVGLAKDSEEFFTDLGPFGSLVSIYDKSLFF
jgi:hypothetical protein